LPVTEGYYWRQLPIGAPTMAAATWKLPLAFLFSGPFKASPAFTSNSERQALKVFTSSCVRRQKPPHSRQATSQPVPPFQLGTALLSPFSVSPKDSFSQHSGAPSLTARSQRPRVKPLDRPPPFSPDSDHEPASQRGSSPSQLQFLAAPAPRRSSPSLPHKPRPFTTTSEHCLVLRHSLEHRFAKGESIPSDAATHTRCAHLLAVSEPSLDRSSAVLHLNSTPCEGPLPRS
jgi:hypothetical protein